MLKKNCKAGLGWHFRSSLKSVFISCLFSFCALVGISFAAEQTLTLATTTSTENSGLLSYLHPDFEKKYNIKIKVVAKGTGASLQLAREGNVDVVLVHARVKEDEFVAQGYGVNRRDVMYNDFVVIGPKNDPAGIGGLKNAIKVLRKIAAAKAVFVSRGDNSGTHFKEQQLWQDTGLKLLKQEKEINKKGKLKKISMLLPKGKWYKSIGQGMGKTINFATEKRAYTMTDRGTYYAYFIGEKRLTDLVILCEGDKRLYNPYGVIAVNPKRYPQIRFRQAMLYINWLTSPSIQLKIGEYTKSGKVLFHPLFNGAGK